LKTYVVILKLLGCNVMADFSRYARLTNPKRLEASETNTNLNTRDIAMQACLSV
jgi:hypothetical protein